MENATKVLLIAASVLIVVLLVTMSIRIFNSTDDVADSSGEVGESISSGTKDASKDLIYILDDIDGKSMIKVLEHTATAVQNGYYSSYFPKNPKILLEPDTKYMLSFDYKVNSADYSVGCGIGCGETDYILDIVTYKRYPNQKEGTFKHTFKTPSKFMVNVKENGVVVGKREITEPYLHIRFARMSTKGNCSVEISNVRFEKVK